MLPIKGFIPFSLIDFPGKIAAVIFIEGCNLQCFFCHNPPLIRTSKREKYISEEEIVTFLEKRKGKIDGVVITGGEPCMHADLPSFLEKIKSLSFFVKVDTNGTFPSILDKIFPFCDYIAMDVKAIKKEYKDITQTEINTSLIKESIEKIKNSGIDYEFRTTLVPGYFSKEQMLILCQEIGFAKKYALQKYKEAEVINKEKIPKEVFTEQEILDFKEVCIPYFEEVLVRNI